MHLPFIVLHLFLYRPWMRHSLYAFAAFWFGNTKKLIYWAVCIIRNLGGENWRCMWVGPPAHQCPYPAHHIYLTTIYKLRTNGTYIQYCTVYAHICMVCNRFGGTYSVQAACFIILVHCKDTIPKIRNKYSQERNCAATVSIPSLMFLLAIYIFLWSVCPFCCRKLSGPNVGICTRSLTDT